MGYCQLSGPTSLPSLRDLESLHMDLAYRTAPPLQTPPESLSGSPRFAYEGLSPGNFSPVSDTSSLSTVASSPIALPSINEFDKGVEALANSREQTTCPQTPPPSFPSLRANLSSYRSMSHLQFNRPWPGYSPRYMGEPLLNYPQGYEGSSSPCSDAEDRHINQKYSTEEGDFIIYAWHEKKMKWVRIQEEFAERFGKIPKRSVQGLQAWYYRMNLRIPVWDAEGWLKFSNEDDLEPRYTSIKCREREGHGKNMEQLGLAQRYPERAVLYSWVDSDTKYKAREWAAKRNLQYRERKERRNRKELRRRGKL